MESDNILLEYARRDCRQIWIGARPPFDMTSALLLNSANFRLSSAHHHRYKIVWFYETLLDDVGKLGYRIVLDELIRLIDGEGTLIIRMRENQVPSISLVKLILGRHIGLAVSLEYESCSKEQNIWTMVFSVTRLNMERYSASDWTFAVLTTGTKADNVVRLLQSIREYELDGRSEIIIAGPEDERYAPYDVKYISMEQFRDDRYAEIAKKKNAVAEAARGTNLMIVHDRFVLGPDFFRGFEKYGYDFDFATVTQYTEDGEEFPGYAATRNFMRKGAQIWVQDLQHLYDTQFINGGLIIVKTDTLRDVCFNDMLMWNQMEDVELTHVMQEKGIVPRVNFASSAVVLEVREGYFVHWVKEKEYLAENAGGRVKKNPSDGVPPGFGFINKISSRIPAGLKDAALYRKLKGLYWKKK